MSIELPELCPRGFRHCQPLDQIVSDDKSTFVCSGLRNDMADHPDGDIFTVCFKSVTTDSEFQLNKQDMCDQVSVMARALSAYLHMLDNPSENH